MFTAREHGGWSRWIRQVDCSEGEFRWALLESFDAMFGDVSLFTERDYLLFDRK